MHSNTRSTMYDRIRYEQAICKEKFTDRDQKPELEFEWRIPGHQGYSGTQGEGHTKGFPPLRLMVKEPSDPTVLVLQVRRLLSVYQSYENRMDILDDLRVGGVRCVLDFPSARSTFTSLPISSSSHIQERDKPW
jgi:hypothetical protein